MPHALWGRHASIQRAHTHVRRMCPTVAVAIISTKREPAVLVGIKRMYTHAHTCAHFLDCFQQSFPSLEEKVGLQSEDIPSIHPSHCPFPCLDLCCLAQTITVAQTDISSLVFSLPSALRLPDHSLLVAKNGHSPSSSPKLVIANLDGTNLATPMLTEVFCPT